jgi:hypothetical protein
LGRNTHYFTGTGPSSTLTLASCCPIVGVAELQGVWGTQMTDMLCREAVAPENEPAPVELDRTSIVRPELFHTRVVSGTVIPMTIETDGGPCGRWVLYLQWGDGRRERKELESWIELPRNKRLWLQPVPSAPSPLHQQAWSAESRQAWLAGRQAPAPLDVFSRIRDALDFFLEFPPTTREDDLNLLALWIILTYGYPCWTAIPYLWVSGALGSGKSRLFEVLARLVFRPTVSANTTAPALFRALNELGGIMLLDEVERLRDRTPDVAELMSVLLSGYKKNSPVWRLQKVGDEQKRVRFDVFGPKAIAGIGTIPEALASRCIPLVMFRADKQSPKTRRRIDADHARWSALQDDLHQLALEHGRTWLTLPGRTEVCPAMGGRDYELWQPMLALAAWLEETGAVGLLARMQDHAQRIIEAHGEQSIPDADECLLRALADVIRRGGQETLTPGKLLAEARGREPALFRGWTPKGASTTMRRYKIETRKRDGKRVYRDLTLDHLQNVEAAYGLDLGLSHEHVPDVPDVPAGAS